ncbi:hypothetical protein [Nostoc sp.]
MGSGGDEGDEGGEGERITSAQCPMPHAQCPMPNAQCPKPIFLSALPALTLPPLLDGKILVEVILRAAAFL